MDATPLNTLVLTVVFAAIALYALYFVIRAGVRDGVLQAKEREAANASSTEGPNG
ncbi:hypothetical protein SAMN04487917_104176 [Arthrobacter sp. yr096]|uniref:hypothetical protein n=1 Tax=unclassified Arthrobacter TaxID=235627 RepID=UPI000898ECF9|nr:MULTISPECIES: hypothetical protein [unclassified Arthrobacter]SDX00888.1 hypothetical protein SAMN04487912_106200 [Arthrobacter sp. cf158]SEJ18988.1 hypothetical protein SAMN04487917_104176 [Arthrobacter sp. yr096]